MTSLADGLPPEIAEAVSQEWRMNEADYWAARPELLTRFRGQWIGFSKGKVVASGSKAVEVLHGADDIDEHAYFARVGAEEEPCSMRRSAFTYDATYPGEPLPVLDVLFRSVRGNGGLVLDRVIADTGADATALPWSDCKVLGFTSKQGKPARIGGVGGSMSATLVFRAWVVLDGSEYPCRLQADFSGHERILGRDVLNRMNVMFCGPIGEVVLNP